MIKHLFKLLWNRKKSNSLLTIEIFLSFLVLFLVLALFYYNYSHYSEPIGFNYENVWNLQLDFNEQEADIVREKLIQLDLSLKNFNEIEEYSFSSAYSYPYTTSTWSSSVKNSKDIDVIYVVNRVDDNFHNVLELNVIEGRWFNQEDDANADEPVVINQAFADEYFGEGVSPIGKKAIDKNRDGEVEATYSIVGVIDYYKYKGELQKNRPLMARRLALTDTSITRASDRNNLILKVRSGTDMEFEEKLFDNIMKIGSGWMVKIDRIDAMRESYIKSEAGGILVLTAIAFFLILNVALGLMGVIWYSVNRRKPEIGLRRAIGATSRKILIQIIGEAIVLGTFAIIIGLVFALQVPILSLMDTSVGIMLASVISASTLIYFLITICSLYPSVLASKIQPVEALHDE
jgi:putative ABC transport system permease protein